MALVVNAVLGIALIPFFGLAGAVLTYAGTRFAELGLAIMYLRRTTTGGLPVASMARLLAVAVVATTIAWLTIVLLHSRFGFIVAGMVFVVVFLPASFLVRYWSDDDYALMTVITNHLGPPGRMLMRGLGALQGTPAKAAS